MTSSPLSPTLRRVRGPLADELFLIGRPQDPTASLEAQAASAFRTIVAELAEQGAGPEALVAETIFLPPSPKNFAAAVDQRRLAYALDQALGNGPASTFIGQAPLDGSGAIEIAAIAVVPRDGGPLETLEVSRPASCPCDCCQQGLRARGLRLHGQLHLHAGNVFGSGNSVETEAFDMFRVAEDLLREAGLTFRDVIRTWIHLRDIDRDYAALNQARRDFFASRGIERRPASTGVQGIPFASRHNFSLSLYAVKSPRPLDVPLMSTPTLNEAWTYGADFSRGLRLVDGNFTKLILSGTASLDEYGKSVHDGDLPRQVERMLRNIETLLEEQGADFGDVVSAITYVKYPTDAPLVREILQSCGFVGFPLAVVESPLCRPELLCETEAVAVLALPGNA